VLLWILIAVAVVFILIFQLGLGFSRKDRRPADPDEPLGPGNPGNLSPAMRAWRRRRAAAGKGDNWLTRPLIKVGTTSKISPDQSCPMTTSTERRGYGSTRRLGSRARGGRASAVSGADAVSAAAASAGGRYFLGGRYFAAAASR
jgi:hypothetical protein